MRKRLILLVAAVLAAGVGLAPPVHAGPAQSGALPRIEVDGKHFVSAGGGGAFQARGANYVRLRQSPKGYAYHSTFEPGRYDSAAAKAVLGQMHRDGYNVVRVFIDPGDTDPNAAHGIGRGKGTEGFVHEPYMDNVADFVRLAAQNRVYVLPALDYFPQNDTYWGLVGETNGGTGTPNMAGENLNFMSAGHAAAKAEYLKRFAEALSARVGADLMTTVLAYSLNNEAFFQGDKAPFDRGTGTVTPLNGVTYDMAKTADRQQAADASIVEYTHRVRRALVTADPDALVTVGAFTPYAVGKTGFNGIRQPPGVKDKRFPARLSALSRYGAVDFVDIHLYPNTATYKVASDLATAESGLFTKPFVVGEMGAVKSVYGGDVTRAAYAMRDLQKATCAPGAQGWLFWTWDTKENLADQRLFFHLTDSRGAINGQLAPIVRPDPCR